MYPFATLAVVGLVAISAVSLSGSGQAQGPDAMLGTGS